MERKYVKPSELYWGIIILFTISFLNLYYSSGKLLIYLIVSLFLFMITLIIGHNKKIRDRIDYKLNDGGKT